MLQTNYCKNEIKEVYAHRLAYIFFKGDIPKGKQVNHLCEDKPGEHYLCCNPDHLSVGTQAENVKTRDENLGNYQKEATSGEKNGNAAFTLEEARDVQKRHLAGEEYKEIALSLGKSRRTVERVCCGMTYPELGDIRPQITEQKKTLDAQIKSLRDTGKSYKQISEIVKRSQSYICGILK
jgi:hypothetical protein